MSEKTFRPLLTYSDEAHRVAGSTGEVARYKLGHLLSQASPYLLLLSATPHNGKTEPFLRLVRLLDAEAFPNTQSIVKEQVAPYLIRTEKREAIDNSGNKLFKNRITHLVTLNWDERHSMQRELYELVTALHFSESVTPGRIRARAVIDHRFTSGLHHTFDKKNSKNQVRIQTHENNKTVKESILNEVFSFLSS